MTDQEAIVNALSTVRDPELDEPITDLGFVSGIDVCDEGVDVRLRLPAYFCAPNFASLMVADAREAVLGLPGVRWARVGLVDHFCADEISARVAGDDRAMPGSGDEDLTELRAWFRRKAFIGRQANLCGELLARGYSYRELTRLRLGDVPSSHLKGHYLQRREELGLGASESALLLVGTDGKGIPEEAVEKHLRFARAASLNTEGNASMCRAALASRYGAARGIGQKEEA